MKNSERMLIINRLVSGGMSQDDADALFKSMEADLVIEDPETIDPDPSRPASDIKAQLDGLRDALSKSESAGQTTMLGGEGGEGGDDEVEDDGEGDEDDDPAPDPINKGAGGDNVEDVIDQYLDDDVEGAFDDPLVKSVMAQGDRIIDQIEAEIARIDARFDAIMETQKGIVAVLGTMGEGHDALVKSVGAVSSALNVSGIPRSVQLAQVEIIEPPGNKAPEGKGPKYDRRTVIRKSEAALYDDKISGDRKRRIAEGLGLVVSAGYDLEKAVEEYDLITG